MTIWCANNWLDQPNITKATHNTLNVAQRLSLFGQSLKWTQPLFVQRLRIQMIAMRLLQWNRLILYAIIIGVISHVTPYAQANNVKNTFEQIRQHQQQHHQQQQQQQYEELPIALPWSSNFFESERIQCPSFVDNSACPCHKLDEGLQLECPRTTSTILRSTLQIVKSPIQMLSLYDFDRSTTSISSDMFVNGIHIRNLKFSNTQLTMLKDNSLQYLRTTLETLAITSSKLNQIPRNALSQMEKLMELDFESNRITSIHDYNFYGLRLVRLNMKSNALESIPEYAFAGLEESLAEIDLSENKIKAFPMLSLRKLNRLRSLRLSSNEIVSMFKGNRSIRMPSLTHLYLDLNRFREIEADAFGMFPNLTTLSLYNNDIEAIAENAFDSLAALNSLDLSHNNIKQLHRTIFKANMALHSCDLTYNHLHAIDELFVGLADLRDVFLSDNNILELTLNTFTNSTNIKTIYLENNAIRHVDAAVFSTLINLEQLYLGSNFITHIPQALFNQTEQLISLSLDRNLIRDIQPGLFASNKHLREIHLRHNRIRTIRQMVFHPLPELIELQLQNNSIVHIEDDALEALKKLQHISLQQNQLTALTRIFAPESMALLSLEIDHNRIVDVHNDTFRAMSNVYVLWLNHNQLNRLDRNMFKDMPQLERLHLYNNSIANIAVNTFQNLDNLRYIDMNWNRLTSIKRSLFTNLKSLEELNLAWNDINEIQPKAFITLKKLNRLDLAHNPLGILQRNTFSADLAYLNVQNCSLTQIPADTFSGLHNLIELNLEQNQLALDVIGQLEVASIRILRLSHNNFSLCGLLNCENVFEKFGALETITMEYCSLHYLPETLFRHNGKLQRVDVSGNMLKTLEPTLFHGLHRLKEFHAKRNLFNDLPYAALHNISTLETLGMSNNILTTFDFQKLNGVPNLRHLYADDNVISSLAGFGNVNLSHLTDVDLSGNILMDLPKNFLQHSNALERIDLANNRFTAVPFVGSSSVNSISSGGSMEDALSQLNWLNLTGNPFTRSIHAMENIESSTARYTIPHLRELFITHTNLTNISSSDFDGYNELQHLHLLQNRIHKIAPYTFKHLNSLLSLDISVNNLETFPSDCFNGLVQLRRFNLSTNRLGSLDELPNTVGYLESLDVSYNHIGYIARGAFQHLRELTELRLAGNRITGLSADTIRPLNNLILLDLRENLFRQIPLEALELVETHLKTVQIEYNPYNCSCETQSNWQWIKDHQKIMHSTERFIKCDAPFTLRGRPFASVTPEEFCPLITGVSVDEIKDYSIIVSWQNREHSELDGFEIFYQAIDGGVDDMELLPIHVNSFEHTAKLNVLSSGTQYRICVIGLVHRVSSTMAMYYASNMLANNTNNNNNNNDTSASFMLANTDASLNDDRNNRIYDDFETIINTIENRSDYIHAKFRSGLMKSKLDTPISRCVEARTLAGEPVQITDQSRLTDGGLLHALLTRRLGLIVGCCLGIFVFIVIISILGWLKLKKRRTESAKRCDQQMQTQQNYQHLQHPELNQTQLLPPPPDYNNTSYRQFTCIPVEAANAAAYDGQHLVHPVTPNCISGTVIGTTTIAC